MQIFSHQVPACLLYLSRLPLGRTSVRSAATARRAGHAVGLLGDRRRQVHRGRGRPAAADAAEAAAEAAAASCGRRGRRPLRVRLALDGAEEERRAVLGENATDLKIAQNRLKKILGKELIQCL